MPFFDGQRAPQGSAFTAVGEHQRFATPHGICLVCKLFPANPGHMQCPSCYVATKPICQKCHQRPTNPGYSMCQPCFAASKPSIAAPKDFKTGPPPRRPSAQPPRQAGRDKARRAGKPAPPPQTQPEQCAAECHTPSSRWQSPQAPQPAMFRPLFQPEPCSQPSPPPLTLRDSPAFHLHPLSPSPSLFATEFASPFSGPTRTPSPTSTDGSLDGESLGSGHQRPVLVQPEPQWRGMSPTLLPFELAPLSLPCVVCKRAQAKEGMACCEDCYENGSPTAGLETCDPNTAAEHMARRVGAAGACKGCHARPPNPGYSHCQSCYTKMRTAPPAAHSSLVMKAAGARGHLGQPLLHPRVP